MPTLRKLFPPPSELALGDTVTLRVRQLGRYDGQGVGYLEDDSQVVVTGGAEYLGGEVAVTVTSIRQTEVGRVIFATPAERERVQA
jgi:uncharacterized protein YacL